MAGTPEAVTDFLAKIRALATDGAKADLEALRRAKAAHLEAGGGGGTRPAGGAGAVVLNAWDTAFYNNFVLKRDYGAPAPPPAAAAAAAAAVPSALDARVQALPY